MRATLVSSPSKKITGKLGEAAATTNPYFVAEYADHTTTAFTEGGNDGAFNGTTDVDVVVAPGASTQRVCSSLVVYNPDTIAHRVIIQHDNAGTKRTVLDLVVGAGQTLYFVGGVPVITGSGAFTDGILLPVGGFIGALTAVVTPATNTTYFQYVGRVGKSYASLTNLFNVTTALITPTWAEVGFAKGTPVHNGAATLTRLGYTDVSGTFASTGLKKTTVALSGLNAGDDLWIAYGDQASTLAILRALLADNLQSGYFQSYAGRLSTMPSSTVTTLVAAATALAWCTAGGL